MWTLRWLGIAGALLLLGSCCTDESMDRSSTQDRDRVTSPRITLGLVYNDSVSAPKHDRTDWKYVMLTRPGKLSVLLHWDNGKARLELDIFDVMGMKIQEGRVFGTGGLRAVAAVEEPGPYYIRIRGAGCDDESQYSVKVTFDEQGAKVDCHKCKPLERKCMEASGGESSAVIVCEKIDAGCNRWEKILPCPPGILCRNGVCDACASPCPDKSQQCANATDFHICGIQPGNTCPSWGPAQHCPAKHHCKDGQCVKSKGPKTKCPATCPEGTACNRSLGACVKVAVAPVSTTATKCHIISVYKYREVWTLHLECPDNAPVRPGQTGVVLEGATEKPLSGGEIRITRASGRYAIANTNLQQLGLNRWVRINPAR